MYLNVCSEERFTSLRSPRSSSGVDDPIPEMTKERLLTETTAVGVAQGALAHGGKYRAYLFWKNWSNSPVCAAQFKHTIPYGMFLYSVLRAADFRMEFPLNETSGHTVQQAGPSEIDGLVFPFGLGDPGHAP